MTRCRISTCRSSWRRSCMPPSSSSWPMLSWISSMPLSTPASASPEGQKPLLEVRDLTVSFRTEHGLLHAVGGISFSIDTHEIVGVVGESGSGKTVSLMSVMGLINDPNAVIGGSIVYKGRQLNGMSKRALRAIRGREIAMIFQDPMTALTPVYTIGWQIREQLRAHNRLSKAAAHKRAIELLAAVG